MELHCLPILNVGMSGRIKSALDIINDGNTVAWFDSAENITKDGSDFVSVWGDKSGLSHDLLQAIGTNQPLWTADGVLFDGVDNFLKCVGFTLIQPQFIYMVLKQVTWASTTTVFDGNITGSGTLQQRTSTPNLAIYAGSFSSLNGNLAVGDFGNIRILFNGVNSKLIVNDTAPTVGDVGAANMSGFTLGDVGGGGVGQFANIQVPEIIIRKVEDTVSDETDIYNYLKSKYGL